MPNPNDIWADQRSLIVNEMDLQAGDIARCSWRLACVDRKIAAARSRLLSLALADWNDAEEGELARLLRRFVDALSVAKRS